MTPLGWGVALVGMILGLVLGYLLGRLKLFYSLPSSSYDCLNKRITVEVNNGGDLHRVYAIAKNTAPANSTCPPTGDAKLAEKDYDGSTMFTISHTGWPTSGTVSYRVWGATFQAANGSKDCGGSHFLATIKDLEAGPALRLTVPDGPLKGAYTATSAGPMKWQATVGGGTYTITCESPDALTVHGPAATAATRQLATGPFSATFPGHPFQAAGDVLVTKE